MPGTAMRTRRERRDRPSIGQTADKRKERGGKPTSDPSGKPLMSGRTRKYADEQSVRGAVGKATDERKEQGSKPMSNLSKEPSGKPLTSRRNKEVSR